MNCPECNSIIDDKKTFCSHVYGTYTVFYGGSYGGDRPHTSVWRHHILTGATMANNVTKVVLPDHLLQLHGFVLLTEDRIEKLLLLK